MPCHNTATNYKQQQHQAVTTPWDSAPTRPLPTPPTHVCQPFAGMTCCRWCTQAHLPPPPSMHLATTLPMPSIKPNAPPGTPKPTMPHCPTRHSNNEATHYTYTPHPSCHHPPPIS
ncbi:hypothetical protein BDZ94DRAFT_1313848 [Collybia nuda]|uniref:Uncharacterized protein n=1 Tax=Collybia nuda TaxID=64659 RepID=A0A9P5XUG4_9AGAR|nr:hypothetical protein BDZ94DRAFT_1313848 [Collybia nuda]